MLVEPMLDSKTINSMGKMDIGLGDLKYDLRLGNLEYDLQRYGIWHLTSQ